jgi:hypothetical protein
MPQAAAICVSCFIPIISIEKSHRGSALSSSL